MEKSKKMQQAAQKPMTTATSAPVALPVIQLNKTKLTSKKKRSNSGGKLMANKREQREISQGGDVRLSFPSVVTV